MTTYAVSRSGIRGSSAVLDGVVSASGHADFGQPVAMEDEDHMNEATGVAVTAGTGPGAISQSAARRIGPGDTGRTVKLTKREVQVLTLVIEGNSSKEVADHLYVSKRTVDFHLANIYHKLGVTNRVQAFREATRRGLITFSLGGAARQ
jgi:DNA-binding CsgD family transcriptional regulator